MRAESSVDLRDSDPAEARTVDRGAAEVADDVLCRVVWEKDFDYFL